MSVDSLREQVRGEVFTEGDEGYDEARSVYNGMIDKRPAVVIGAVDDADVIAGVRYAAESGLDLSIRGGGHSVPGFGTNDDGVVIDLERMKGVRVDPEARTTRAQGGATWGDLDHATHAFGLHTTGGIIFDDRNCRSDTGWGHRLPHSGLRFVSGQPDLRRCGHCRRQTGPCQR